MTKRKKRSLPSGATAQRTPLWKNVTGAVRARADIFVTMAVFVHLLGWILLLIVTSGFRIPERDKPFGAESAPTPAMHPILAHTSTEHWAVGIYGILTIVLWVCIWKVCRKKIRRESYTRILLGFTAPGTLFVLWRIVQAYLR
jgi:hypothetical protein